MEKRQLDTRAEIGWLVRSFYAKVRKDELIGPIFNNQINDWEIHLERLTDFWETNLSFIRKYKGNPIQKHIEVDQAVKTKSHKCILVDGYNYGLKRLIIILLEIKQKQLRIGREICQHIYF